MGAFSFSLREAEEYAIQNHYQIRASLLRLDQGYYAYLASQKYFASQTTLSSEGNVGQQKTDKEWSLDAALVISRPLYDKVAYYLLQQAQIEWEQLRLEVQQQICETLFEVRQAYYTQILHQLHLDVDQRVIKIWEEEQKRQERILELGATIPLELTQVQLHLKSAWVDYWGTKSDIRSSQIKLLTILGLSPGTPFELTETEIPLPSCLSACSKVLCGSCSIWEESDIARWRDLAFQYRPQLQKQQLAYALSQNKIRQIRAEKQPKFTCYASAGHHYVNYGFDSQPSVGVGVNVDWALYDPTNKPRMNGAKRECLESAVHYTQAELETEAAVHDQLNTIQKAYYSYLAAKEGAALAEESMKMANKKHEFGQISSFEYRDVVKGFHEAKEQVHQSAFDIRNAYDKLIQETGLDLQR